MDKLQKNKYRNLISVIAGTISSFLVALILFPIVRIIFDKYFHLFENVEYPQRDSLIISITLILWFFISSSVAGTLCTLIAKNKEWLYVFLSMFIVTLVLTIISKAEIFEEATFEGIVTLLMIPAGYIAGKLFGTLIKRNKAKNKEEQISLSDIPSSPSDTAEQ